MEKAFCPSKFFFVRQTILSCTTRRTSVSLLSLQSRIEFKLRVCGRLLAGVCVLTLKNAFFAENLTRTPQSERSLCL